MVVFIVALGVFFRPIEVSATRAARRCFQRHGRCHLRQCVRRPRQLDAIVLKASTEAKKSVSLERIEITPFAVIAGEILRSEEHTSELQSQSNLVCRLLLEKKKKKKKRK